MCKFKKSDCYLKLSQNDENQHIISVLHNTTHQTLEILEVFEENKRKEALKRIHSIYDTNYVDGVLVKSYSGMMIIPDRNFVRERVEVVVEEPVTVGHTYNVLGLTFRTN